MSSHAPAITRSARRSLFFSSAAVVLKERHSSSKAEEIHLPEDTQNPAIAMLYFRQDYVKLQEVHQVMEEMEVTQGEMKMRLRWALTKIPSHPDAPNLMEIQIPVETEVAKIFVDVDKSV